jgi:gliding motility-associated lipoprotein GldH
MKNFKYLLAIIILIIVGCGEKHFYEEYQEIPGNVWKAEKPVVFTVNIDDANAYYDISLNIRHAYNYQYSNLWLFIRTISADGKMRQDSLNCILADNDMWNGSCLGDICDLEVPFGDSVKFANAGTYTFEIYQGLRIEQLPFISEIGLIIDKIE